MKHSAVGIGVSSAVRVVVAYVERIEKVDSTGRKLSSLEHPKHGGSFEHAKNTESLFITIPGTNTIPKAVLQTCRGRKKHRKLYNYP